MIRKKILAANWKMNLDLNSAINLANGVSQNIRKKDINYIFFPPSIYIREVVKIAKEENIFVGSQNCSEYNSGAYTGEISAEMIKSCGANYCLVGHSERRTIFVEADSTIRKKIERCLESEINPVLCVGENLDQRKSSQHFEIVKNQLYKSLEGLSSNELLKIIFAYEPVWAIGTGLTASPVEAQQMHAFIREEISGIYGSESANKIPILYGGSCNSNNAKELFACADVDGGLIGSASLKGEEFLKIADCF
ncbi:MAG: triose-phosphate isomerase [Bacteroidota bacterium]|jgi:triosephosphate isomerase